MEKNVTVLETPEVVKHTDAEWYRDVSLEDAEVFIRSNLQSAVRSVIATGFYLKHIRENELYLEAGYKNINEYAMDRFGLSASATSRYITRNTRFSRGGNSPLIDDRFKDFSKSQLQEMLGMDDDQLGQVTPDMTVREIRSIKSPKEIPYIEIPGQTELKDIPDFIPEQTGCCEMAAADLFQAEKILPGIEEPGELPTKPQEITVTELFEEEAEQVKAEDLTAGRIAMSQISEEDENAAEKQQAEPEEQLGDIEFLKKVLHRENKLLSKFLAIPDVDINDPVVRKQKLIVGALASILCDFEEQKLKREIEKTQPVQPELPILKNDMQRKAFIDDYTAWPIWIETKETGERYYRYELPDAVMVVKVYYHKCFDYNAEGDWKNRFHDDWGTPEYYLIQDSKHFKDCLANKSCLIDYLKEIQRGEKQ